MMNTVCDVRVSHLGTREAILRANTNVAETWLQTRVGHAVYLGHSRIVYTDDLPGLLARLTADGFSVGVDGPPEVGP
jgi:hypothetical protein